MLVILLFILATSIVITKSLLVRTIPDDSNIDNDLINNNYIIVLKDTVNINHFNTFADQVRSSNYAAFNISAGKIYDEMGVVTLINPSQEVIDSISSWEGVENVTRDDVAYAFGSDNTANYLRRVTNRTANNIKTIDINTGYDNITTEGKRCPLFPYNWGLDRIDQKSNTLSCSNYYNNIPDSSKGGKGVGIYVLDTGVQSDHIEFLDKEHGIVKNAWTYYPHLGSTTNNDGDGHGTHVASIAAGRYVGVAPNADILAVKVLNDKGTGSYSNIIDALDRIIAEKKRNPNRRIIVSMSLGGRNNAALNRAVEAVTKVGVPVIVAAGNEAKDACKFSPANAKSAITVAAAKPSGAFDLSYSNYGPCVDVTAPGSSIQAACATQSDLAYYYYTKCDGNSDYLELSGTSMAVPFVAGVLALYIRQGKFGGKSASPDSALIKKVLQCTATSGVVRGTPNNTPNKMLFRPNNKLSSAAKGCILNE